MTWIYIKEIHMENRPATTRTAASAQRRQGTDGDKSKKKKRFRVSGIVKLVRFVFLVLLAALIIVGVIRLYKSVPSQEEVAANRASGVFIQGVSVYNTDVSGLNFDTARALIMQKLEEDAKSINITVAHGNTIWLLSGADMAVATNIDAVLTDAIDLGFDGSYTENRKAKSLAAEEGASFDLYFIPDRDALVSKLGAIAESMNTAPVEPTATADAWADLPQFEYIEGSDGYTLNEEALASEIAARLEAGELAATLTPELELTPPEHDIEWVKANTQLRATWQTSFGGSRSARDANRVGNIQKATTILNGAKIENGAQFDFNDYIGPRTEEGGWPLAPGIVQGNSYELQAGGGICQVSTTLYISLLMADGDWKDGFVLEDNPDLSAEAPIIIDERHHHSWPSSYADRGLDATVSTGGKNLRFINNTGAALYIFAYCDSENYTMTIYLYGAPLEDGVTYTVTGDTVETIAPAASTIVENPNWPAGYSQETTKSRDGYKSIVYRQKYINGVADGDPVKLYTDSYRAVQGVTTVGTGPASLPTPS